MSSGRAHAIAGSLTMAGLLALGAAASAGALVACNSIANVDLTYADAGEPTEAGLGEAGPGVADGGELSDAPVFPQQDAAVVTTTTVACDVDGSVCDQTQGLGCCLPAAGAAPFCVDQQSARTSCGGGVFLGCVKSDSTSESQCCWNGTGAGAFTAYAGSCGARPFACSTSQDCPIGTPCNTVACHGVTVGACGAAPTCP